MKKNANIDYKHLTVEDAWMLCYRMWRWIYDQIRNGDDRSTSELKSYYMERIIGTNIHHNCWFCEYCSQQYSYVDPGVEDCCRACPGKMVDPNFNCQSCMIHIPSRSLVVLSTYDMYGGEDHKVFHWYSQPRRFYNKIRSMYKKFKKMDKSNLTYPWRGGLKCK